MLQSCTGPVCTGCECRLRVTGCTYIGQYEQPDMQPALVCSTVVDGGGYVLADILCSEPGHLYTALFFTAVLVLMVLAGIARGFCPAMSS
jgi:hypothetical protein